MLQFAVFCATLLVSGAIDIGHNIDLSHLFEQLHCPAYDCMYVDCPTGQLKQNYVIVNGVKCPSCQSCMDTTAVAARDVVSFQMPCPIFDCMYLQCPSGQWEQNYMTINGHHCPSCRSCVGGSAVVARDLVAIHMPCPIFDCMYVECLSGQWKQNYMTINGHQCPSCSSCLDSSAVVARDLLPAIMMCPLYECAMMVCPNGQYHTSYTIINGHKCPTCPTCSDFSILTRRDAKDMGVCPSTMCMTSDRCDHAHLENSYFSFHGKECPGCPTCAATD